MARRMSDDYISRRAVLDMLEDINNHIIDGYGYRHDWCVEWVKGLPSIDAVQVIRCKDCKYNLNNDRLFADPDPILTYAWCNTEAFQENDFCSKGKRKEE